MNEVKCHICEGRLSPLNGFASLLQITSDCRPWKGGGQLAVCESCGTVQKPVTEDWLKEAGQIYAGYEIYSQGGGDEQSTFDQSTGGSESRSKRLVEWLITACGLPGSGELADIGCGNGAFLRAFGARFPRWLMTGLELDSRNREAVESIPGAVRFHAGPVDSLQDRFDLIVLVHTLEHIPNPVRFLDSLKGRLRAGGMLLIEVPNIKLSPFDILIADHCTHFTESILRIVSVSAGYELASMTTDFVPKELTLLARITGKDEGRAQRPSHLMDDTDRLSEKGADAAAAHIAWLTGLLQQGREIDGQVGIFGTSISGTWLAASLGGKVSFFVDEDRNRIGRLHLSHPIYDPACAPGNLPILVPMRSDIAAAIAKRFKQTGRKFVLPS